jgi:hypothetical protein
MEEHMMSSGTASGARRLPGPGRLGVAFDLDGIGLELSDLQLLGVVHRPLDLGPHVRDPDHHQPGLPGIQVLAQFLEVTAPHPGHHVPGHRPQHGPTASGRGQQATPHGGEGEQGHDQPGGQPYPSPEDRTGLGRRLVLLGDLDLAVGPPLEYGGVVGVDQSSLCVEVLDQFVVASAWATSEYTPT